MISSPQPLPEVPLRREGTLAEVPFASLLFPLAVRKQTLVLEVRRRQLWKKIILEHGVPVDCRSNLAHETLGRYLVLEGKLSEDDFTGCLSKSAARGAPFGEVLLEQGLISAVELFKTLQQNLAKKLLEIFTWREGEFQMLPETPVVDSSLKVKVPQLILTGVMKFAPQEEVDMAVGPMVGKKLAIHPSPPFPLEEIRLSASQGQLVEAVRPGRRMGELAEATGLPFDEITRTVYALSSLGILVPADALPKDLLTATGSFRRPAMPVAAPAPPAPVPQPPAAAPAPPDLERRRNEIMQAYLSYRRQDAFDLLGVPEDATAPVWEAKYLEFAKKFAPWTLDHPELAALEERARDLFLAGARAFSELADVEQRNTLLFRRKTLREERAKKSPSSFAIKTDLLDSEAQYKKGKALLEAGKTKDALVLLEFASDCDPTNGLYAAEMAYCRFLCSTGSSGQAIRELQEALRRDPGCGIAAFYAGEIHRQLGAFDEAEPYLRKAIKLMSPDRRPIEALRLLSAERKR
ncbi:MAG TPA: DUF4388 domain-containing protein [Thermoanaerobaculia bacterium]|nr:DUF4388 domain-containing protein [Thermoanaerobaculia bacterium]